MASYAPLVGGAADAPVEGTRQRKSAWTLAVVLFSCTAAAVVVISSSGRGAPEAAVQVQMLAESQSSDMQVVKALYAAFEAGALSGPGCKAKASEFYAEDAITDRTGSPCAWYGNTYKGPAGACEYFDILGAKLNVTSIQFAFVADGSSVLVKEQIGLKMIPSGHAGYVSVWLELKVANGKITHDLAYWARPTEVICS